MPRCSAPRSHRPLVSASGLALLLVPVLLGARGCEYDAVCPAVYAPVCAEDGATYPSACEARRAGLAVLHEGECGGCLTTSELDLVCGVDGVTYSNPGWAACAGIAIAHWGECGGACVCPENYAPVCGEDGVTYGNGCEADCAGTAVAYDGACGCGEVFCTLHCDFGFVPDPATGCPTCTCNPEPPPEGCLADTDCPAGLVCELDAFDCPPGALCAESLGVCVAPALPCATDADCPEGLVCNVPAFDCPPGALCPESLGECAAPPPAI